MKFEQVVRVPRERVGVIIGRAGEEKNRLEKELKVRLRIDSETGDVTIGSDEVDFKEGDPFRAIEIVDAIGKGFSPFRASRLLKEEQIYTVIDLREQAKTKNSLERIKGRIIGEKGKARRVVEELTGASVSVYGHYAAIIGEEKQSKLATSAIESLASGSEHKSVYNSLQRARTQAKLEKLKLWED